MLSCSASLLCIAQFALHLSDEPSDNLLRMTYCILSSANVDSLHMTDADGLLQAKSAHL